MEILKIIYIKVKNPKYDGYQREIMPNQQLAEEIHKPIIKRLEKQKLRSSFIDNIWGANFSDMQLICKFN